MNAVLKFDRLVAPVLASAEFEKHVRENSWRYDWQHVDEPDRSHIDELEMLEWASRSSQRIDCKAIPTDFLLDTGTQREEEILETGEVVRLPFGNSIFEFEDCAAIVGDEYHLVPIFDADGNTDEELHFQAIAGYVLPLVQDFNSLYLQLPRRFTIYSRQFWEADYEYNEPMDVDKFEYKFKPYGICHTDCGEDEVGDGILRRGYLMLLGLLTLLDEQLLHKAKKESVPAATNAKLRKAGIRPIPPHHVLTLNLAETRRRAKVAPSNSHESPRLHWRRGHYRTIGRMSEFERRSWIRRCLVGDVDKGFVSKLYRPIWQPMIH